jgi:hypothetical protein
MIVVLIEDGAVQACPRGSAWINMDGLTNVHRNCNFLLD